MYIDSINHHLGLQKMVLKSATEDDESKIRAMKSAAESGSIKSPFTIVAYDVNEFCAHDFIHINFVVMSWFTIAALFHLSL